MFTKILERRDGIHAPFPRSFCGAEANCLQLAREMQTLWTRNTGVYRAKKK